MPPMRCNRASLMQTKLQQFSTMEASLTLNIGAQIFICTPALSDFTVKQGNRVKTNVSVPVSFLLNEPGFGVYVMKVWGLRKPKSTIRLCLRATCPRRSASASWTSSLCSSSVSRWRVNIFPLLACRIGSPWRHPDVVFEIESNSDSCPNVSIRTRPKHAACVFVVVWCYRLLVHEWRIIDLEGRGSQGLGQGHFNKKMTNKHRMTMSRFSEVFDTFKKLKITWSLWVAHYYSQMQ